MDYSTDKISIIVPVYNVEPYIRRCLDSIVGQTYKNLEIIIINDGSTDNSGCICDDYAKKDTRVKVLHKNNGGLSSALNNGLNNISGDYIGFVDSDDWTEPYMFELLYNEAKKYNVPLCTATYFTNTGSNEIITDNKVIIPTGILSTKEILLHSIKRDSYTGFCGYVWNKLYSTDIVKESGVYFDENIRYAMDALFFTKFVLKSKCTGVYINKPVYHYFIRESSLSNKNPIENSKYAFAVYEAIADMLSENGYDDVSLWAKRFYCYFAGMYAEIAIYNKDGIKLNEMQNEIKRYLSEYKTTNEEHPERLEWIDSLLKARL